MPRSRARVLAAREDDQVGGAAAPAPDRTKRNSTRGCARSASKSVWLLMRGQHRHRDQRQRVVLPGAPAAGSASSASSVRPCRYGSTPSTGLPVLRLAASRGRARAGADVAAKAVDDEALDPRLLAGATGSRACRRGARTRRRDRCRRRASPGNRRASANPMLAMSRSRRLISAGLPAPSTTTRVVPRRAGAHTTPSTASHRDCLDSREYARASRSACALAVDDDLRAGCRSTA